MTLVETALAEWSDFPIDQTPRPIVFLDSRVQFGPGGFVDVTAKMAYGAGAVESSIALPDGVLELLTEHDQAWDRTPLEVTSVRPVDAAFLTDRRDRQLAAFEVEITGLREPCAVLDPQVPIWWPRSADQWNSAGSLGRL